MKSFIQIFITCTCVCHVVCAKDIMEREIGKWSSVTQRVRSDGYYVGYQTITLPCISFMFIEMKFIYRHFLCDVCNEIHEYMQ